MSNRRAFGPRSLRSRQSLVVHDLEKIIHLYGRRSRDALDVLVPKGSKVRRGHCDQRAVTRFVAEATSVCKIAHLSFRRYSAAQRASLRGFSVDLLVVAAERTIALDQAARALQHARNEAVSGVGRLAAALDSCQGLCDQAHAVLGAVASSDVQMVAPSQTSRNAAGIRCTLAALSSAARMLLRHESNAVRHRCRLYSLDDAYARALDDGITTIDRILENAVTSQLLDALQADVDHAFFVASALVLRIANAFDLAHRVDAAIAPLANAAAVRRASTIAPPLERPQAPAAQPESPPRDVELHAPGPAHGSAEPNFTRRIFLPREVIPLKK